MGNYIDRQIASDAVQDTLIDTECPEFIQRLVDEKFDKIPAADVVPVVYGRWNYDKNATDWGIGGYVCNVCKTKNNNLPCNRVNSISSFIGIKYCPNCGARMVDIV